MAKKQVDRATIDLVRAGISAHHAHRWIKALQRSRNEPEPDWMAYRNALAYLTLTEKHLTDWLAVAMCRWCSRRARPISEAHPEARKGAPRKISGHLPGRNTRGGPAKRRTAS